VRKEREREKKERKENFRLMDDGVLAFARVKT
jgi:hypothetical protein